MSTTSDEPPKRDVKRPLLFECAWEVANKGEQQFPQSLSVFLRGLVEFPGNDVEYCLPDGERPSIPMCNHRHVYLDLIFLPLLRFLGEVALLVVPSCGFCVPPCSLFAQILNHPYRARLLVFLHTEHAR